MNELISMEVVHHADRCRCCGRKESPLVWIYIDEWVHDRWCRECLLTMDALVTAVKQDLLPSGGS